MTKVEWELAGIRADPVVPIRDRLVHPIAPVLAGDRIAWDGWPNHPAPLAERMAVPEGEEQTDPWTGATWDSRLFNRDGPYQPPLTTRRPPRATPPDLLARFIALETAPAAAILRFASTWGALGLCEHGLPWGHPDRSEVPSGVCYMPAAWGAVWEEIAAWRGHAARARALLSIAADIYGGRDEKAEDWQALARFTAHPDVPDLMAKRLDPVQREAYTQALIRAFNEYWPVFSSDEPDYLDPPMREMAIREPLRWWLEEGHAELSFNWQGGRARLTLDSFALYGVLGIQLLSAVTRADGLTSCAGCGAWFLGGRVGGRGRNRYCDGCGRRGAMRDASRRYREKKRQSRSEGHSTAPAPARIRARNAGH